MAEGVLGSVSTVPLCVELARDVDRTKRLPWGVRADGRVPAPTVSPLSILRVGPVFPLAALCGAAASSPEREADTGRSIISLPPALALGAGCVLPVLGTVAIILLLSLATLFSAAISGAFPPPA